MTAYASWNGATGVAAWRLLAGERPDALRAVASTRADGFETALRAASAGPHFAVQALDRSGATLGESTTAALLS